MYAIFKIGSKQYKAKNNQIICVEKLNFELGKIISFDKILMIFNKNIVKIGKPFVKDIIINCEIIEHGRLKKIDVIKFKRRKNSRKKNGHRQWFTKIKIKSISKINGEKIEYGT